jgi:hypothetical protein
VTELRRGCSGELGADVLGIRGGAARGTVGASLPLPSSTPNRGALWDGDSDGGVGQARPGGTGERNEASLELELEDVLDCRRFSCSCIGIDWYYLDV